MIFVQENCLMLRAGFVGNLQQALNYYSHHILEGETLHAVPAATNCFLFENVLENKPLRGIFFSKEEHEQRGNTHLCYFPARQYQSWSFDSNHTWWGHLETCGVCNWIVHYQWLLLLKANWACIKINFPELSIVHPSFGSYSSRLLICPSCCSL